MRVWVLVTTFPSLTTTFLGHRIQGLIDRGFEVDILAEHPEDDDGPIAEVQRPLIPRIRWASRGRGWLRWMSGDAALAGLFWRRPFVAVHAWNPLRFRGFAGIRLAAAAAAAQRLPAPDAVLGCFGPMGELACSLRRLGVFDAPVVTSFHGVDAYGKPIPRLQARYRSLRAYGDLFLPVSRHMADHLAAAGFERRRTFVLHTPIRCASLPWRAPRRCETAVPVRIVAIGRLVAKKGFDDALRVLAKLAAAGTDARLEIIGDGVESGALAALATDLGIADRVVFAGGLPHAQVAERLRQADLLLSTSKVAANGDSEGIPNAIKEALAIGLPVVATRHTGIPEIVVDGVTGLLADEGDVDALADACRRLVGDHRLALSCSVAGRRTVETAFDEVVLNDRLARLIERSAGRWRRRWPCAV